MIKFFRKIRYQLLGEGKTGKYLKYAIGEIVLVVIGILIAISINNWNEDRKQQIELVKTYQGIENELEANLLYLSNDIENQNGIIDLNLKSLKILYENNVDSLLVLRQTLSVFDKTLTSGVAFPVIQSFIESEKFSKMKDKEFAKDLRLFNLNVQYLRKYNQNFINGFQKLSSYVTTNLNYVEINNKHFKDITKSPEIAFDYSKLPFDQELINLLAFKVNETKDYQRFLRSIEDKGLSSIIGYKRQLKEVSRIITKG